MNVKERIISLKLLEKKNYNVELFRELGIDVSIKRNNKNISNENIYEKTILNNQRDR